MRADGKIVKDIDPMYALIPYFLKKRYDAMNMITLNIPEEPLKNYMNDRRKQGMPVSHLALIIAAYIQVVAEFPALNRFTKNRKIFQRNELSVSMVVLRPGDDTDAMAKLYFDEDDTINDVQRKVYEFITENREETKENKLDKAMRILTTKLRPVLRFALGIVTWADEKGLLPKALIEASPFHASMLISDLASIRTNHIYHHIYEFGTTSIGMTLGNLVEVPRRSKGEIVFDRCIPIGLVMDERICSGHYFAQAFARMREYLRDPKLLEIPFSEKGYIVHK